MHAHHPTLAADGKDMLRQTATNGRSSSCPPGATLRVHKMSNAAPERGGTWLSVAGVPLPRHPLTYHRQCSTTTDASRPPSPRWCGSSSSSSSIASPCTWSWAPIPSPIQRRHTSAGKMPALRTAASGRSASQTVSGGGRRCVQAGGLPIVGFRQHVHTRPAFDFTLHATQDPLLMELSARFGMALGRRHCSLGKG
jgi:hypothetical protein